MTIAMSELKAVKFYERRDICAYNCESGSGHSGEYVRAEEVRELVEALERISRNECDCRRYPELCNCSSNIASRALDSLAHTKGGRHDTQTKSY